MRNPMIFLSELIIREYGGSAWESNPPANLDDQHTGFEVREDHQDLTASV